MKKYIILLLFFINFAFVFHHGKLEVTAGMEMRGQTSGDETGDGYYDWTENLTSIIDELDNFDWSSSPVHMIDFDDDGILDFVVTVDADGNYHMENALHEVVVVGKDPNNNEPIVIPEPDPSPDPCSLPGADPCVCNGDCPPPPEPEPNPKIITYKKNSISHISNKSLQILKNVMDCADVSSLSITSTIRTPHSQALAMYDNCNSKGVDSQYKLYSNFGDQVIDTYSYYRNLGYGKDYIVMQMENKINDLGSSNVSKHCGDPSIINVFDIAPSSVDNDEAFIDCAENNSSIRKFYSPMNGDPAYHFEIIQ